MAIRDHIHRVPKLRGIVTTVDPSQRIVELAMSDGNARRLFVSDINPSGFTWPVVGESWSTYQENGYWILGNKFLNQDEAAELEALNPGEKYPPTPPIPSSGDKNFVFVQSVASDTWVVNHDLDKYPAVQVTTSSGHQVEMDVTHNSTNQATLISPAGAFSGKAIFN